MTDVWLGIDEPGGINFPGMDKPTQKSPLSIISGAQCTFANTVNSFVTRIGAWDNASTSVRLGFSADLGRLEMKVDSAGNALTAYPGRLAGASSDDRLFASRFSADTNTWGLGAVQLGLDMACFWSRHRNCGQ
jgi:hypothetical protein